MENSIYQREIDEAIRAGQRARSSLLQAKDCLKSAGNWGLLDMFGGGWCNRESGKHFVAAWRSLTASRIILKCW